MSVFPRQDVGGALARARMYGHARGDAPIHGAGAGARRDVSGIDASARRDGSSRPGGRHGGGPCTLSHDEENMTTTNELARFFEEGWNRHAGRERVRDAFARVFAVFPDARFDEARHFVAGERGVSEWVFRGTRADGTKLEVNGCDLFTFTGGKIALKSSYFKTRA